jgi:hypothetical protein
MATANQPITRDIFEAIHPIIDFTPYYDLIHKQAEIGWNQLHLQFLEQKHQKTITGELKWLCKIKKRVNFKKAGGLQEMRNSMGPPHTNI